MRVRQRTSYARRTSYPAAAMAETPNAPATPVSFDTHPSRYKHWKLEVEGELARLTMQVDPNGGLRPGYELKLNSYDIGVDVELADASPAHSLRAPAKCAPWSSTSGDRPHRSARAPTSTCSAARPTAFKVNFCKYTNETRLYLEDLLAPQRHASSICGRERHRARVAATSWPWLATRSYLVDDGSLGRELARDVRCSPCCRAPAASRASSTSVRCVATAPTCSPP
jgi:hypothetical protein